MVEERQQEGQQDRQNLGGNISLTGFKDVDSATMIIIKKIVGNFVKDIMAKEPKFQSLSLRLKELHKTSSSAIYLINANMAASGSYNAEAEHRNLLFAIDSVLKKIESQAS